MVPKVVRVAVKYSKPGIQPPVYIAGSFSDPAWQPQEMQHTINENGDYEYTKEIQIEEGKEYQYKYRIGSGEWWLLSEDSPTVTDDIGNRNNLLLVPVGEERVEEAQEVSGNLVADEPISKPPTQIETQSKDEDDVRQSPDTQLAEDKATNSFLPIELTPSVEQTSAASELPSFDKTNPPPPAPMEETQIKRVEDTNQSSEVTTAMETPSTIAAAMGETRTTRAKEVDGSSYSALNEEIIAAPTTASNMRAAFIGDAEEPSHLVPSLETSSTSTETPEKTPEPIETKTSEMSTPEKISSPTLVVEKMDSDLRYGDDFGAGATIAQKDAHHLRAQDAEPDYVVVRHQTPEFAGTAAEVADSARFLDRDQPTPPISDEEAGRIGYRRMSQTPIPQVANTAAEVADAALAATLDEDEPTSSISEEVAGQLGGRRMSHTPIPEVANTAAEVADVAAVLDRDKEPNDLSDTPVTTEGDDDYLSDCEGGPRFPYEEGVPPTEEEERQNRIDAQLRKQREEEERGDDNIVIDPNDPRLEYYTPAELTDIIRQLRRNGRARGIPSDIAEKTEVVPGVVTIDYERKIIRISPKQSPAIDAQEQSQSLDLIEENEDENDQSRELTQLPDAAIQPNGLENSKVDSEDSKAKGMIEENVPRFDVKEVESKPMSLDVGSHPVDGGFADGTGVEPAIPENQELGLEEHVREISTGDEGPNIMAQPASPRGSSTKTSVDDPFNTADGAKSSAIEEESGRSQLTARKQYRAPTPDRPLTPSSMRSAGKEAKSRNFLKTFFRVVFVDWIGGLIMRLCGGRRRT